MRMGRSARGTPRCVAASTSPMPDSVSSSVADAELMLIRPPTARRSGARHDGARRASLRHQDLVPSVSSAARLSRLRSAFGSWPPARSIASMTRSPSANSYTPGCSTSPATSTMIVMRRTRRRRSCAATPGATWAIVTGLGSERAYQGPAPPSAATSTTIDPAISPLERVEAFPERHACDARDGSAGPPTARHVWRRSSMRRSSMTLATNSRSP